MLFGRRIGFSGTPSDLMPAELGVEYTAFAGIFVASLTLGILAHTPGGIGVFEAMIGGKLNLARAADVISMTLKPCEIRLKALAPS